jgi:demethylmenaquinone methyltransferase/2-methoxy-6-polyprenyl-1,4-benzoquinol methylase
MRGERGVPADDAEGDNKDPARIAAMFDAIAARYDLLNHLLSAGFDRWWRRRAIRSLRIQPHDVVLDLCTGTGDVAIAAAGSTGGRARVIGIDFAGSMLTIAREKTTRGRPRGHIRFVQGDASRIPLASQSVDAVTVAFGIRNIQHRDLALRDMARVLKPGGRLAMLEFGMPRTWGLRQLYRWYFRHVLPRIGALISGHRMAYAYLPASVALFPQPEILIEQLAGAGFQDARAESLTFGIVYLYRAVR